jgi:FkbM family methyltransferase
MVFGFEPNPKNKEFYYGQKLNPHGRYIHIGNHPHFYLVECALGLENGKIDLYVTEDDEGCSSVYKPATFDINRIEHVDMYTLSSFFELFPFDRFSYIEFIKIDAQGADLDIIKGAGHYLKDYVVYVTAEDENVHYLDTKNSVQEIDDYMINHLGFQRINHPNTRDPTYVNPKWLHVANDIFIYQH